MVTRLGLFFGGLAYDGLVRQDSPQRVRYRAAQLRSAGPGCLTQPRPLLGRLHWCCHQWPGSNAGPTTSHGGQKKTHLVQRKLAARMRHHGCRGTRVHVALESC